MNGYGSTKPIERLNEFSAEDKATHASASLGMSREQLHRAGRSLV